MSFSIMFSDRISMLTILLNRFCHFFSIKTSEKLHNFFKFGENTFPSFYLQTTLPTSFFSVHCPFSDQFCHRQLVSNIEQSLTLKLYILTVHNFHPVSSICSTCDSLLYLQGCTVPLRNTCSIPVRLAHRFFKGFIPVRHTSSTCE